VSAQVHRASVTSSGWLRLAASDTRLAGAGVLTLLASGQLLLPEWDLSEFKRPHRHLSVSSLGGLTAYPL